MKVTVRVKCSGERTLEGKLELKGPFNTGHVVTLVAGITGVIVQALSRDYIEVSVERSVYQHFSEVEQWPHAF